MYDGVRVMRNCLFSKSFHTSSCESYIFFEECGGAECEQAEGCKKDAPNALPSESVLSMHDFH